MGFGDILDGWEKDRKKKKKKPGMGEWMEAYPPKDEDVTDDSAGHPNAEAARLRKVLRNMEPQRTLDLHGLTRVEAMQRVDSFLDECRQDGLTKVLIVHGKGHHSKGEPVLGPEIRRYVSGKDFTGESQTADNRWGGSGAFWVILR